MHVPIASLMASVSLHSLCVPLCQPNPPWLLNLLSAQFTDRLLHPSGNGRNSHGFQCTSHGTYTFHMCFDILITCEFSAAGLRLFLPVLLTHPSCYIKSWVWQPCCCFFISSNLLHMDTNYFISRTVPIKYNASQITSIMLK